MADMLATCRHRLGAGEQAPVGLLPCSASGLMVPTAYLREQAEKCRRLASDVVDSATRTRLEVLAGEYEAQADFQDQHGPGELRRPGPAVS